jgi:hypothetical protein
MIHKVGHPGRERTWQDHFIQQTEGTSFVYILDVLTKFIILVPLLDQSAETLKNKGIFKSSSNDLNVIH